jgi:uncharacterized membrane protein YpjA
MLIWYANLPEETSFYWPRQDNPWWAGVSLLLLFGHFFGPFLALISRYPKRRPGALALAAIWLLLMHWVDLYWLVRPATPLAKSLPPPLTIADVALLAGIGGIFAWALLGTMGRHALLPERDPRLAESLAFQNV